MTASQSEIVSGEDSNVIKIFYEIGIGGRLAAPPLPHRLAYGPRTSACCRNPPVGFGSLQFWQHLWDNRTGRQRSHGYRTIDAQRQPLAPSRVGASLGSPTR